MTVVLKVYICQLLYMAFDLEGVAELMKAARVHRNLQCRKLKQEMDEWWVLRGLPSVMTFQKRMVSKARALNLNYSLFNQAWQLSYTNLPEEWKRRIDTLDVAWMLSQKYGSVRPEVTNANLEPERQRCYALPGCNLKRGWWLEMAMISLWKCIFIGDTDSKRRYGESVMSAILKEFLTYNVLICNNIKYGNERSHPTQFVPALLKLRQCFNDHAVFWRQ